MPPGVLMNRRNIDLRQLFYTSTSWLSCSTWLQLHISNLNLERIGAKQNNMNCAPSDHFTEKYIVLVDFNRCEIRKCKKTSRKMEFG